MSPRWSTIAKGYPILWSHIHLVNHDFAEFCLKFATTDSLDVVISHNPGLLFQFRNGFASNFIKENANRITKLICYFSSFVERSVDHFLWETAFPKLSLCYFSWTGDDGDLKQLPIFMDNAPNLKTVFWRGYHPRLSSSLWNNLTTLYVMDLRLSITAENIFLNRNLRILHIALKSVQPGPRIDLPNLNEVHIFLRPRCSLEQLQIFLMGVSMPKAHRVLIRGISITGIGLGGMALLLPVFAPQPRLECLLSEAEYVTIRCHMYTLLARGGQFTIRADYPHSSEKNVFGGWFLCPSPVWHLEYGYCFEIEATMSQALSCPSISSTIFAADAYREDTYSRGTTSGHC